MGKVLAAAVVAVAVGAFVTTAFSGVLGTQAEVAALGATGLTLLGASQLFSSRGERSAPADGSTPSSLGSRVKVPA